jgi:hypothetical protein
MALHKAQRIKVRPFTVNCYHGQEQLEQHKNTKSKKYPRMPCYFTVS